MVEKTGQGLIRPVLCYRSDESNKVYPNHSIELYAFDDGSTVYARVNTYYDRAAEFIGSWEDIPEGIISILGLQQKVIE